MQPIEYDFASKPKTIILIIFVVVLYVIRSVLVKDGDCFFYVYPLKTKTISVN